MGLKTAELIVTIQRNDFFLVDKQISELGCSIITLSSPIRKTQTLKTEKPTTLTYNIIRTLRKNQSSLTTHG